MFVLAKERLAWWPVMFPSVADDGSVIENKIELRFVILGEDQFPTFIARLTEPLSVTGDPSMDGVAGVGGEGDGGALAASASDSEKQSARAVEALLEVVRDWRHVAGENGEPLPFNRDNFGLLLNVPNAAGAIGRAYVSCRNATPEIRQGN